MNAIAPSSAPVTGPALDNRRILAALIDICVVTAGSVLLFTVAIVVSGGVAVIGQMGLIAVGWTLYYYFALESGNGQTLGKKVMKLRVVRADGGATGMREIAVRTVLRVVDGMALYLVGLVVMLVSGSRRQRLGDMAAGTIVVDASSAPAPAAPAPAAAAPQVAAPPVEPEHADDAYDGPVEALPPGAAPYPGDTASVDIGTPLPGMTAPEHPSTPAVEDFKPFSDPAPVADEPQVEVVPADSPDVEPVAEPAPYRANVEEPSVEIVSDEPPYEDPAPEPRVEIVSDEPPYEDPAPEPRVEIVSDEPPYEDPAPEPQAAAGEMTMKPVETVSALDQIMGDDGEDEKPPPPQDDAPAAP